MPNAQVLACEHARQLSITHHDRRYEPGVEILEGYFVSRFELEYLAGRGIGAAIAVLQHEALEDARRRGAMSGPGPS
jgi:hypothetical protein